ncbi:hypothetical protein AB0J82_20935 [Asanoa sp. NPDC049518]|uniref:hypothetical protein n=1 Tax=unclassified Asanoa TaxID=2685164 RepID=UPI00343D6C32
MCDLGEHHRHDQDTYVYRLTKIEVAKTSSGAVFVPGARWDRQHERAEDSGVDAPPTARRRRRFFAT